ncbi:MAG: radical SAM protein [Deltaproteobacteria bacterium]|nr:radical SAM protein [Deltaproteobacteria bacterium]
MTNVVKVTRKTPVLQAPAFGCLKGVPAVNITRGCLHACVYCYARGFSEAPPKGEIHLYYNLPEVLKRELDCKRKWPRWVAFSTASDPFQALEEVLAVTYRVMELLLRRGIGVSFLTKGEIPPDFVALFRRYPDQVTARIGLTTMDNARRRLLEPQAPPPGRRLAAIRNLREAGIPVSVRLDPIIAGVSDGMEGLENLLVRLRDLGVKNLSLSYLVLRPGVMKQIAAELPPALSRRLLAPYLNQPWQRIITSARTRLLPREWRQRHSQEVKHLAAGLGLQVRLCGCKNPDLEWESCEPWDGRIRSGPEQMAPLFLMAEKKESA